MRFTDDLVVLISLHPRARHWAPVVERRLREELAKLDLTINEEKTRVVDFSTGKPFDFLGYTFRWVPTRKNPAKKMALARPQEEEGSSGFRVGSGALTRSRDQELTGAHP